MILELAFQEVTEGVIQRRMKINNFEFTDYTMDVVTPWNLARWVFGVIGTYRRGGQYCSSQLASGPPEGWQ